MSNQNNPPEAITLPKDRPVKSIMNSFAAPFFAAAAADNQAGTADHISAWKDKLIEYIINHAGALLSALAVIVVGLLAARWIGNFLTAGLRTRLWNNRCGRSWCASCGCSFLPWLWSSRSARRAWT
jgi:hypothetical protein